MTFPETERSETDYIQELLVRLENPINVSMGQIEGLPAEYFATRIEFLSPNGGKSEQGTTLFRIGDIMGLYMITNGNSNASAQLVKNVRQITEANFSYFKAKPELHMPTWLNRAHQLISSPKPTV